MIALRCQKNRTWDVRGSLGRFRPFPRLCDRIPLCSQRKLFLTGPGDPNRAFEQSRIALPVVDFMVGDFERSENGPCSRGCDGYLGRGPHGLGEISPRPPPRIKIAGKSPTRTSERNKISIPTRASWSGSHAQQRVGIARSTAR